MYVLKILKTETNCLDKIFSESGNVRKNVYVYSLEFSVIFCILQMNVSVFPTRSVKYRMKELKKCICINRRENAAATYALILTIICVNGSIVNVTC